MRKTQGVIESKMQTAHDWLKDPTALLVSLSLLNLPIPDSFTSWFFLSTSLLSAFPCQIFLAFHFCTNWLSQLWLGNQVGSTSDHL